MRFGATSILFGNADTHGSCTHDVVPPTATSGGNPRSDDRMTAVLWCRSSLGGIILGGTHVIEGPEDGFFGGAVLHPTH